MTKSQQDSLSNPFNDDLADIAAGDTAAVDRHLDLLSDNEAARDLRHEVSRIADELKELGDDYKHPADFQESLLGALPGADTESGTESETESETESGTETVTASESAVGTKANESKTKATESKNEIGAARQSKDETTKPGKRMAWAGGMLAAAAAVALFATGQLGGAAGGADSAQSSATAAQGLMSAQIIQIDRSANDGSIGFTVSPASSSTAASGIGQALEPGQRIDTDSRTRLVLRLSDGSQVTLDALSSFKLHASELRSVELLAGELVADVAHLDSGPNATYRMPHGRIEVLGTKFSISADGEHGNLRVMRGKVALHGDDQSRVTVHAGEEAVMDAENAPSVSPALRLAESIRWSELGPEAGDDQGGSGLGELRAYKPGQKRDRDWPMALESHKVTVRLVGNIARTEIEEVFRNDSATVLEGVYKFPLPANAQIDKLALDVDGKFEEGAIVEKVRATKIWNGVIAKATKKKPVRPEELIWVPGPWKDPALLEQKEGNRFELRIYPIPKRGTRTIRLAYTQVISPQGQRRRYTYPLPRSADGSSVAENFSFDMRMSGVDKSSRLKTPGYELTRKREGARAELNFSSKAFVPNGDVVVEYLPLGQGSELRAWGYQGPAATAPGLKKKRKQGPRKEVLAEQERLAADTRAYALVALQPELPRWTEEHARDLVITIDSSQSMVGERFDRAQRAALELFSGLDHRDQAVVLVCDIACKSFKDDPVRSNNKTKEELKAWLKGIEPAGASFFENSLERAAMASRGFAGHRQERERVVVYIGDGVASMGHRSLAAITKRVSALRDEYQANFTTVAIGADADTRALSTVARAGGGYFIERKSGQSPTHMAQAVLESTMGVALRDAELVLPPGMSDISPIKLSTLRAGDEILVTARYAKEIDGKLILRGMVGGKSYENSFPLHLAMTTNAGNAFVPKIWANQTIDRMESEGLAGHGDTIVAMSKSFGVMSKRTSLLVLESEAMFRAFGVDRAKPLAQWTGEDGEAEMSESVGAVGYGDMAGESLGGLERESLERLGYFGSDAEAAAAGFGIVGRGTAGGGGLRGGGGASTGSGKGRATKSKKSRSPRNVSKKPRKQDRPRETSAPKSARDEDSVSQNERKTVEKNKDKALARRRPAPEPIVSSRSRRPGSWMKKVWSRVASVGPYQGVSERIHTAVDQAEKRLADNPDSRDRHRDLVQALSYADELARAEEIAIRWLERDRLDPEALSYLADIAARRGRRDQSIRLLSGIVDLRPEDRGLHKRLAKAYDRAGDRARACAHRVMLAELSPTSAKVVGDAIRCEKANGRPTLAESLLAMTPLQSRGKAAVAAEKPARSERIHGDLRIDATWAGSSDLDIAIITPRGRRISWQGGHRRVAAAKVREIGAESLGMARLRKGRYLIEISRTHPESREPVQGRLKISVMGQRQNIPFELLADSKVVSTLRVRMVSRMVPL